MDDAKPDGGLRRAMVIGFVAYLAMMAYLTARAGDLPRAEYAGEMLVYFLLSAGLAGWLANGRQWSWLLIAGVYIAFTVAIFVVKVVGKK